MFVPRCFQVQVESPSTGDLASTEIQIKVVEDEDRPVVRKRNTRIPVLLKNKIK